MPEGPATVDDYIACFEPGVQAILRKVRAAVRAGAPKATEVISYRMPALRQRGILVYYAAFKGHIGFYPPIRGDAGLEAQAAAYAGEKGNLRFALNEPVPYRLLTALTRLRAEQDRAPASAARQGQAPVPAARQDKPPASTARRRIHPMPDDVAAALRARRLDAKYQARPPYQRNDYIGWITEAKREATRQRRLDQMLEELAAGDRYMKMPWRSGGGR